MSRNAYPHYPIDDYFAPLLARRLDPRAQPRHLVMGCSLCEENQYRWQFHTAGSRVTWTIPLEELARNRRIIRGMDIDSIMVLIHTYADFCEGEEADRQLAACREYIEALKQEWVQQAAQAAAGAVGAEGAQP